MARCIRSDFNLQVNVRGEWHTCHRDFEEIDVKVGSGAIATTITCPRISAACPDMFCPANCAGRGTCIFEVVNGTKRSKCDCFDSTDTSLGCSNSLVEDGKYLDSGEGLESIVRRGFFDPMVAVFVDHPETWTTTSWGWAAGLFALFLLMILCICSSFWPDKRSKQRRRGRRY